MQQYCAGDASAFETLYRRHELALHRYLCRLLGRAGEHLAHEVQQDTWLKLVNARQSWRQRDDATFKTWLYTLAHHRAIDVLRQSDPEISVDGNDDASLAWALWPAATSDQPEQRAFWRRAGQQLLDCLDTLPVAQRSAFLMHHEEGLSLADMSALLQVEFETLKSRLRYALGKLRQCMGAYLAPMAMPSDKRDAP